MHVTSSTGISLESLTKVLVSNILKDFTKPLKD